jgi:uncharacterized secreted protein with C-terminal beta-propeller domain
MSRKEGNERNTLAENIPGNIRLLVPVGSGRFAEIGGRHGLPKLAVFTTSAIDSPGTGILLLKG